MAILLKSSDGGRVEKSGSDGFVLLSAGPVFVDVGGKKGVSLSSVIRTNLLAKLDFSKDGVAQINIPAPISISLLGVIKVNLDDTLKPSGNSVLVVDQGSVQEVTQSVKGTSEDDEVGVSEESVLDAEDL